MLWGTVSKALQKSRYDGVWLGNYICQFPQDPGVHLLESNGLVYLQVPQVVSNLNFSYEGRDFVPPVPALRFGDLRDVGREITTENWGNKIVEYLSLLHVGCHQFSCLIYQGAYIFFNLPFLADLPVKALLILRIPCQIQLQLRLSFPDPIPMYLGSVLIFFPGYMSLVPLPTHFLLTLYLTAIIDNYIVRPLRALIGLNGPDQPYLGPPHPLPRSPSSAQTWAFSPCLSYVIGVLDSSSATAYWGSPAEHPNVFNTQAPIRMGNTGPKADFTES
ncbi:hypothetical protein QYF61_005611 [Mycteria americana]|uniref:Uncharacterized protein n=1 Tax=Mycteria americana TaxID=33587 RepID=A0AAN7N2E0_MYCAM|nr:hypothetical protein QYF61_005611 [Mycteria americana]